MRGNLLNIHFIQDAWRDVLLSLRVIVNDKDAHGGDDFIASTVIKVSELIKFGEVSGWFQLCKTKDRTKEEDINSQGGRISLKIIYKPKNELTYRNGDG